MITKINNANTDILSALGFKLLELDSLNHVYLLKPISYNNPTDFIEQIFDFIMLFDNKVDSIFLDLSYIYGTYGDWLWKCNFITDKLGRFYNATYQGITDTQLSIHEEKYLKQYLYQ